MPLIAPVTIVHTERRQFRLKKELIDKLCLYAKMIHSPEDHVISYCLESFFTRDKDFQNYLESRLHTSDGPGADNVGELNTKKRGRPAKSSPTAREIA
jgi:hypothetical protein